MITLQESAEMALKALKDPWGAGPQGIADAIIALENALKQSEKEANHANNQDRTRHL